MSISEVYVCQCSQCQQEEANSDKQRHHEINLLMSRLDEQQRRWYVAVEANRVGYGGIQLLSQITGMDKKTIRRGQQELKQNLINRPTEQIRMNSSGRKRIENKNPSIITALEKILDNETAGDPMSDQKWIRSSLRELSRRLAETGFDVSRTTISRLLTEMDFSLKANKRRQLRMNYPGRDDQFRFIAAQREAFSIAGLPIISVDTKKKELIGEFINSGRTWRRQAEEVNEHDFPSEALCKAIPYGIYDVTKNSGFVFVGISCDTPEFAVDNITKWWEVAGQNIYPKSNKLLILADSGGSNGYRSRSWKLCLQEKISDQFGLAVTVCHYPPGCSKWNPVEHRLFSYVSINWAEKPLKTIGTMLAYIRGTSTTTGLTVEAFLQERQYKEGKEVSKETMKQLSINFLIPNPQWNYIISPRT